MAIAALAFLMLSNDHPPPPSSNALVAPLATDPAIPAAAAAPSPRFVDEHGQVREYVPDEVLVRFRESATDKEVSAAIASLGARVVRKFRRQGKAYQLRLPAGITVTQALASFSRQADVEAAEPNHIYHVDSVPNDPYFSQLWGLDNDGSVGTYDVDINAPEAWDTTTGDAGVFIGVLDTGVDYTHPDLVDNIWTNPGEVPDNGIDDDGNGWIDDVHGYDIANDDPDPMDDDGHGTHVAGIIAAAGNNGIGTVGVMWHASIISCKFLDNLGFGTDAGAVGCLEYFSDLHDAGIDIIATNNSWGGTDDSAFLLTAISQHRQEGIAFVAAAGNDSVNTDLSPHYPSSYTLDNIISVAALDPQGHLASFSNFGPNSVDIAAPGEAITSTWRGSYYTQQGTSMAAPFVTGVIGLIKANDPPVSSAEIRSWILAKAKYTGELAGRVSTDGFLRATIPSLDDDNDGMPDRWEQQFGFDPLDPADAALDADSDGLTNLDEFLNDTDPHKADTDGDGLGDGDEVHSYSTDPTLTDTDSDGLDDNQEVNQFGTDPTRADTDSDGVSDGDEIDVHGTDPLNADSDGDGLSDGWEVAYGFDPLQAGEQIVDSDGDGLDNAAEFSAGSNPLLTDTDSDGLSDGDEVNQYGTDPANADTDGDRMLDEWEIRFGLDPLSAGDASLDTDGDGYSNLEEFLGGTDPTNAAVGPPTRPWSNRNGSSRQTAYAPIMTDASQIALAWQLPTTGNRSNTDIISDGQVTFFERNGLDTVVKGIDAITGKTNWTRTVFQANEIADVRGLDGEVVIYGSRVQGLAASLWLFDTASGAPTRVLPVGDSSAWFTAVTTDKRSFFARVNDELVNIDTGTGQIAWRTPLVTADQQAIGYPTAVNESYVVGAARNSLFAFDRLTGSLLFTLEPAQCTGVDPFGIMIDSANRAFVTGDECVWAADLDTRQILWEIDSSFWPTSPSMDQDALYVENNGLQAIDKATGATLWQWHGSISGPNIVSSMTHVFVDAWDGLTAISKATHLPEWSHPVHGRIAISDEGVLTVESERANGLTAFNISVDSDGDGLPDNWEQRFRLNQLDPNDATLDSDHDGLTNLEEFDAGSNPIQQDSDGDGINDYDELNVFGTDIADADSDGDGLSDGDEIEVYGSNPVFGDTDRDGITDGNEVHDYGSDPTNGADVPQLIFEYNESFESGMPAGWVTPPDAEGSWAVQEGAATEGSHSLAAANFQAGQQASIQWTGSFAEGDLYYDAMVEQAPQASLMNVFLDGHPVETFYGNAWQEKGIRIPEGRHTIRFDFEVRASNSPIARIDNVRFRVAKPFATDPNHVVALANGKLWEIDLHGNALRMPMAIPDAQSEDSISVTFDHRIVVGDDPYLHFYDPVSRRFSRKFVGQWKGGEIAAYEGGLVLGNPNSQQQGVILTDVEGNYVGEALAGRNYVNLSMGLDGYLYGLRKQDGYYVDRIDLPSFSVLQSIAVDAQARGLAVDSEGTVFVSAWPERLVEYGADGTLSGTLEGGGTSFINNPEITSNGALVLGNSTGEMFVSSTSLEPLQRFQIESPEPDINYAEFHFAAITRSGKDSDEDGIPDWWEYGNDYDPFDASDAPLDPDADGLDTLREFQNQTDPAIADTDNDGLSDGVEVDTYGSNPLRADSDGDELSDLDEITVYFTDPNLADTDSDGLSDRDEVMNTGTDPLAADSDSDGMSDGWEVDNGLNPLSNVDAALDPDADGLSNVEEFQNGTDRLDADTDGDSLSDGEEVNVEHTSPLQRDTDDDWLDDGWELMFGFNPLLEGEAGLDPDADGYTNLDEYYVGTDPTDPAIHPVPQPWTMHQGNSSHTAFVPIHIDPTAFQEVWTNPDLSGLAVLGPATIGDGTVSFSAMDANRVWSLHALDLSSGSTRWTDDFALYQFLSAPTAYGNALFVQAANVGAGVMQKLDATTGELDFETPFMVDNENMLAPTEYGGLLYAYNESSSGVAAYRTDSPGWEWSTPLYVYSTWAFAVDNDSVYATAYDGLTVLDRQTGAVGYVISYPQSTPNNASNNSTIVDRFGRVYVLVNGNLMAFDTKARKVDWAITTEAFEGYASFASGLIYAVESGAVVAIDSRDGSEVWRWTGTSTVQSSIVVTLDYVLFSTYSQTVVLDRKTGQHVRSLPAGGQLTMDQAGTLIVTGFNGEVSAFRPASDRDNDGIPDGWEDSNGLNADDPADAALDPDGDGLSNLEEFRSGTNPNAADSDGDGLSDAEELHTSLTDPNVADTDGDGLDDGVELSSTLTDPLNSDTDGDRLADGEEVNSSLTDPFTGDSDGDGIGDFDEVRSGSDPLDPASTPQEMGAYTESFEGGVLPPGWSVPVDSEFGWNVEAGDATDGNYRLSSDELRYPGTASIEFTGNFPAGWIQFDALRGVDHHCCATIEFYVGGELSARADNSSWQQYWRQIPAGIQSLRWDFVVPGVWPDAARRGLLDLVQVVPDRDYDFMPDSWEVAYGFNPDDARDADRDPDADSVNNVSEYLSGTSPLNPDTDSDGMYDGFEIQWQLDPNDPSDADDDPDGDGLDNLTEFNLNTSPRDVDSDHDGMPDDYEVSYGLDPASGADRIGDPDADGLVNHDEYTFGTSPLDPDTDGDTMPDGWEVSYGLDPLDPTDTDDDPDADGLDNITEYGIGTKPDSADSDHDELPDGWEVEYGFDPVGTSERTGDPDGDGLLNLDEYRAGTSPLSADSDGDGMPDGWEVDNGLDPLADDSAGDPDGDGVSNLDEYRAGTDPQAAAPPPPPPPPPSPPPGNNAGGGGGGGGSGPMLIMGLLGLALRRRFVAARLRSANACRRVQLHHGKG